MNLSNLRDLNFNNQMTNYPMNKVRTTNYPMNNEEGMMNNRVAMAGGGWLDSARAMFGYGQKPNNSGGQNGIVDLKAPSKHSGLTSNIYNRTGNLFSSGFNNLKNSFRTGYNKQPQKAMWDNSVMAPPPRNPQVMQHHQPQAPHRAPDLNYYTNMLRDNGARAGRDLGSHYGGIAGDQITPYAMHAASSHLPGGLAGAALAPILHRALPGALSGGLSAAGGMAGEMAGRLAGAGVGRILDTGANIGHYTPVGMLASYLQNHPEHLRPRARSDSMDSFHTAYHDEDIDD